ncbi:MAG: flagellar biosynthesis protein FlhF [Pseudohongiellaceae bacterium]|jgi:flagellar biosynthesis protein FlhF
MAVKKFYASDMRTAMKAIRAELGDDAIILSTRKLADGVEVSASADAGGTSGDFVNNIDFDNQSSSNKREQHKVQTTADAPWYLNSINGFEEEHSALHKELGGITSLLQNWMDQQGWENYSTKSPVSAKLWERLRIMGLDSDQISFLLASLSPNQDIKTAWQQTLSNFSAALPVVGKDLIEEGGVFAFLGSAGVGKTTTIGKLATQYVLDHGADSIALITTDRFRIAAHEQLRTYGKILGVSVQAVDESNTLESLLNALRHKKLVLVDTAGISVNHKSFEIQLSQLENLRDRLSPILLLSTTSQAQVQAGELKAYSSLLPVASILTKTDEAVRLGESFGLLMSHKCPVAYTTHGQSIPDDIVIAESNQLISRAVAVSRQRSITKDQVVAGFSSVHTNAGKREVRATV